MRDEENQIGAVLKGYVEGFAAGNVEALLKLWDSSQAEQVTYLPAESSTPYLGLKALEQYYTLLAREYVITTAELHNVRVRFLSGDIAYALCEFVWEYGPTANPSVKLGFTSRGSVVLRKRGKRWLYEQFHESVTWTPPSA